MLPAAEKSPLVKRDLADLLRSALMCLITREMCGEVMKLCKRIPQKADFTVLKNLIEIMADLLAVLPEFSMNETLKKLSGEGKLNSHAEMTLKGNAENSYCRSYIAELYQAIYLPEAKFAAQYVATLPAGEYPDAELLKAEAQKIRDNFYATPLSAWQEHRDFSFSDVIKNIPDRLQKIYLKQ